jgi:hypothetical protein
VPKVIFPTGELLQEFKFLEDMFAFYDGGLKGLVRDMVLTADFADTPDIHALLGTGIEEAFHRALKSTGLIEKVMRDYVHSPDARLAFVLGDNHAEHAVEIAAEALYQRIFELVNHLFMRTIYEISKQYISWDGDDLITHVDVLEERPNDS